MLLKDMKDKIELVLELMKRKSRLLVSVLIDKVRRGSDLLGRMAVLKL